MVLHYVRQAGRVIARQRGQLDQNAPLTAMPSTQPADPVLPRLSPQTLHTLAEGDRKIERIAGFFADEARAQAVFQRLRSEVGLPAVEMMLLRPADGQPLRFARVAEAWIKLRRPERGLRREHRSWGGVLGAVLVGLLSWLFTLLDPKQDATAVMGALLLGAVWGAVVGVLVVVLLERLPKLYRFDRNIQRELRARAHAVVVLQVPVHCQAEVLALVRGNSRGWCAEAPRSGRR
jgi:hypothetical protein